jgi:para-aminobenzoate synthetase component 2
MSKINKMFRVFSVDNYDSFTFNLVDYFRRLDSEVIVYRNNLNVDIIDQIKPDLIVLSPGPSIPKNAGNLLKVIDRYHAEYPIFGVCLGNQAIIEYFGGELDFLDYPYHGKQSLIRHDGRTIYKGIHNPFPAGRYHSLIGKNIPKCLDVTATLDRSTESTSERLVMGVRHKELPIEGVQFHPESILTFPHGIKIIKNVISWAKR